MTLPVILNTYRCTTNWGSSGTVQNPDRSHNVFHIRATSPTPADIASVLALAHTQIPDILVCMPPTYALLDIDVIKLDGSSAGGTFPITPGIVGSGGASYIPQGCAVASWHTAVRGPAGRGRTYFGPISESAQDNGVLGLDVSSTDAALQDFIDYLAGGDCELVIASYVHTVAHTVLSGDCDGFLRTQRRRQTAH